MAIINNKVPRTDVVFYLVILNTTGGADIGDQSLVNITVLSHDNAYGLIGFANVSYTERVTTENFRLSHDYTPLLNVPDVGFPLSGWTSTGPTKSSSACGCARGWGIW